MLIDNKYFLSFISVFNFTEYRIYNVININLYIVLLFIRLYNRKTPPWLTFDNLIIFIININPYLYICRSTDDFDLTTVCSCLLPPLHALRATEKSTVAYFNPVAWAHANSWTTATVVKIFLLKQTSNPPTYGAQLP